jgi:predicted metal-dependent hydrolase
MLHKVADRDLTPARAPAYQIPVAGRAFPVDVARHPRARRYVVRVTPDGRIRLTVPRRASIAGGLRFAANQEAWILRECRRQAERAADWGPGTTIWFRGERVALAADAAGIFVPGVPRGRALEAHGAVRDAVERSLRAMAAAELPLRTRALAAAHAIAIRAVSVRNQRSRWGSCSTRGTIALNWRLIQMPPAVADYVIVHELAHRRHPNHSPRFWREVEALWPPWREAERWLRRHGRDLL